MSLASPAPTPQPPSLVTMIATALFRHLLTGLAGVLAGYGVFGGSQSTEAQFVTVGLAVLLWGLGQAWSWWQASQHHTAAVTAASTTQTLFDQVNNQAPVSIP